MENAEPLANECRPWLPFALLLSCYALLNFFAPALLAMLLEPTKPSTSLLLIMLAILGCLSGQLGALAAWGALGDGRAIVRWGASVVAGACLLAFSIVGLASFVNRGESLMTHFRMYAKPMQLLPLALLAVQVPLWGVRFGFGYRIVDRQSPADRERFALRDVFTATAMVAAAVALVRIPIDEHSSSRVAQEAIMCILTGVVFGLLGVMPCIWSALHSRAAVRGSVALAAYAAFAILICGAVTWASDNSGPGVLERVAASTAMAGAAIVAVLAVLHGSFVVLRWHGYVLRRVGTGSDDAPT